MPDAGDKDAVTIPALSERLGVRVVDVAKAAMRLGLTLRRLGEWKEEHREHLADVPDDAVIFDVGRALGGSFARVRVAGEYVDKFEMHLDTFECQVWS